jgi:ATP-dependent Clp protease ATP-binding subunit ClpB
MRVLQAHFRPEFLNRIDEVIVFDSLTLEQLQQIVEIQLQRVHQLLAERRITLEVTEAAKTCLAQAGWDPVYGARPLKRAIQRELQDPLALKILQGEFREGDTLRVEAKDGQLIFTPGGTGA